MNNYIVVKLPYWNTTRGVQYIPESMEELECIKKKVNQIESGELLWPCDNMERYITRFDNYEDKEYHWYITFEKDQKYYIDLNTIESDIRNAKIDKII